MVSHLPQHLSQRWIASQVGAQQHGIDKEAEQALDLQPRPIGQEVPTHRSRCPV